jgi:D-amino-acid dehydrogenase
MQGISQGPATGKIVAEIVNEETSSIDIAAFNPERYD